MAIKFQYNKTSLHNLTKQLRVREKALPTLKNKEAALRVEVKKAKTEYETLENELQNKMASYKHAMEIWDEFENELITVEDVKLSVKKIAGVKTPVLDDVIFDVKDYSMFNKPDWFLDGIAIVKELATVAIESEIFQQKTKLLEHARRKTTQKVNLYEKVQIPGFQDAIRKIKRYMEDEENLSKAAQKIVKSRIQEVEESV